VLPAARPARPSSIVHACRHAPNKRQSSNSSRRVPRGRRGCSARRQSTLTQGSRLPSAVRWPRASPGLLCLRCGAPSARREAVVKRQHGAATRTNSKLYSTARLDPRCQPHSLDASLPILERLLGARSILLGRTGSVPAPLMRLCGRCMVAAQRTRAAGGGGGGTGGARPPSYAAACCAARRGHGCRAVARSRQAGSGCSCVLCTSERAHRKGKRKRSSIRGSSARQSRARTQPRRSTRSSLLAPRLRTARTRRTAAAPLPLARSLTLSLAHRSARRTELAAVLAAGLSGRAPPRLRCASCAAAPLCQCDRVRSQTALPAFSARCRARTAARRLQPHSVPSSSASLACAPA
jgi:hypothetical protein